MLIYRRLFYQHVCSLPTTQLSSLFFFLNNYMGTFTNQPSPQADFDMILVAVGHRASACPLGTLYPLVTVIGYRAQYVVLPVSVWGKIIFNYFSKAKMVGRVTRFFTLKGSHAHTEDSFSFKKCIKKVVEQAVVHSSINKWNSCRGTAGGRLLLLSYSRGNSSHFLHFVIILLRSLLVYATYVLSSRL